MHTPDTDESEFVATHGKGSVPFLAIIFAKEALNVKLGYAQILSIGFMRPDNEITNAGIVNNYQGNPNVFQTNFVAVSEMTENTVTFASRGGNYLYKAGVTYYYIIAF